MIVWVLLLDKCFIGWVGRFWSLAKIWEFLVVLGPFSAFLGADSAILGVSGRWARRRVRGRARHAREPCARQRGCEARGMRAAARLRGARCARGSEAARLRGSEAARLRARRCFWGIFGILTPFRPRFEQFDRGFAWDIFRGYFGDLNNYFSAA